MHDRLGSVRLLIYKTGYVFNRYTYNPFGEMFTSECSQLISNPFRFAGQWYDSEIGQYYLRARMYDPYLGRFTTFDPIRGGFTEPLTLHKYLYCLNDPVNRVDLNGRSFWNIFGALSAGTAVHSAAIYTVATGVRYNNDFLINTGLQMEHFVAPAMYLGAMLGPYLPSVPGAITNSAVMVWEGLTSAVAYTSGVAYTGAEALSYWAMAHPYEVISIIDVIAQFSGPPDATMPITPAGFVAWLYQMDQIRRGN